MKISGEVDMKSFLKPKTQSLDNVSSSKDDLEYSHEMNCESDFGSPEISYKNKTNDSTNNEFHNINKEDSIMKKEHFEIKEFREKLDLIMEKIVNLEIRKEPYKDAERVNDLDINFDEYDPLMMCRTVNDIEEL